MSRQRFYQEENLDIFFNGMFSEDCFVEKTTNIIGCIFDDSSNDIALGAQIFGSSIVLTLKNQDIEDNNIEKGDTLIIRDTKYEIKNLQRDGSGVTDLEIGLYEY